MELAHTYPKLEDHISASRIITHQRSEFLVYNTVTGEKKRPNEAVFNFLELASGEKSVQEIVKILSCTSGESPDDIWPGLTNAITQMVDQGLLQLSDSPFKILRSHPPSVEVKRRLETVSFEITRQCNLLCRHCYADAGKRLEDEMTIEEIKHMVDQLYDIGVLSITFSGGEPLLHPHLFEIMEYARKKPMTVLLFTNGTLITPEIVKRLKDLQVYKVNISIDGPDAATHDTFRGVEGAFQKTVQGVTLLRKAKIPLHASISINKLNYKKMKQMLQLIGNLGFSTYKIWLITFSGRSGEKEIFITPSEFREAMKLNREYEIESQGTKGKKKEKFYYRKDLENCGIGLGALSIKCNGVVTPCPSFGEEVSLGNVKKDSILDIWNNSELLNTLRTMSVYRTDPCKECEFAAVCKGGCIADIYERSGEFSCYDEYLCASFEVVKDDFIPVPVEPESDSLSVEMV